MKELEEISKEIKRLSNDVYLLSGLVRELQLLIKQKIEMFGQLKVNAPALIDLRHVDFSIKNGGSVI